MTQPEKERTVDDAKVEQVADAAVFEVYAKISVLRCDKGSLTKKDQEEALDVLALVLGGASAKFTFISSFDPIEVEKESEPVVEEVQAAIHVTLGEHAAITDELESRSEEIAKAVQDELDEAEDDDVWGTEEEGPEASTALASKKCVACHVLTTQLDANQCPMCGNPFT